MSWFTLQTIFSKLVIYTVIFLWFCWTCMVFQSTLVYYRTCFTVQNLLLVWDSLRLTPIIPQLFHLVSHCSLPLCCVHSCVQSWLESIAHSDKARLHESLLIDNDCCWTEWQTSSFTPCLFSPHYILWIVSFVTRATLKQSQLLWLRHHKTWSCHIF